MKEIQHLSLAFLIVHGILRLSMPRPPSKENEKNPLRLLRFALRKKGSKLPITVAELSKLIDVPANTIRAVQNKQRELSPSIQKAIGERLFAAWHRDKWIWKYSVPPQPYSFDHFEQYLSFITKFAPIPETDLAVLQMRITALFEKIPKDKWMKLFWKIQEGLEECRGEFGLLKDKEVARIFVATADKTHFGGMAGRNLWLQRAYLGNLHASRGLRERSEQMEVQGSYALCEKVK